MIDYKKKYLKYKLKYLKLKQLKQQGGDPLAMASLYLVGLTASSMGTVLAGNIIVNKVNKVFTSENESEKEESEQSDEDKIPKMA